MQAAAKSTDALVFRQNPMAWDEDWNRVSATGTADRANGFRSANQGCDFAIAEGLTGRDGTESIPDLPLEGSAD